MQKLTLGFSPCPNDTFIFDALVNEKIDTEGLSFEPVIEDVETLNERAFKKELDITKLSYFAFAHLKNEYLLMDSGSALGNNCGPLLISTSVVPKAQIPELRIAIPGKYTTANFLFSLAFPKATNKIKMLFSKIEDAVLQGKVDAGVIIHENRFTYETKGLKKILDLGEYWEQKAGLPIPLGCIAVRKDLPKDIQQKINRVIRRSVEFALSNPASSKEFVRKYSQELDAKVIQQHINLYVNDYTVDLGEKGRGAVKKLFEVAEKNNLIKKNNRDLFLTI